MKSKIRQKMKKYGPIPLLVISLGMILVFTGGWFLYSSQTASKHTVQDVSEFYLKEFTTQTIGHFQTSLKSQIAQLQVSIDTLADGDLRDLDTLQNFMKEKKKINAFDFMAYIDRDGMVYTTYAVFPGISRIDSLMDILKSPEAMVSFNQTLTDKNMVLISIPMEPTAFEDTELVAALVGLSKDMITSQLSLQKKMHRHILVSYRQMVIISFIRRYPV